MGVGGMAVNASTVLKPVGKVVAMAVIGGLSSAASQQAAYKTIDTRKVAVAAIFSGFVELGYQAFTSAFTQSIGKIEGSSKFSSSAFDGDEAGTGIKNADNGTATGYHATKPEYVDSIKSNGFRESVSGRAGGGGVYVNNTPQGAIAEYSKYYPTGPTPEIIKVQYNTGVNVFIENPGNHISGPLPIFGDTITFESTQLAGTFNTIIRFGTIFIK